MREHRVCRFVGRNRSKAPSWRFCILFVGITIEHILPSLKTVAAWCWSVSLLNLYSIPPSLYIEKTTPCPMNFIETKVHIYMRICERRLFHFMRHDIVFLLHSYIRFLPVSFEILFRKNALFSCQENFSLGYTCIFRIFFKALDRDYRKFHPRCNFDSLTRQFPSREPQK